MPRGTDSPASILPMPRGLPRGSLFKNHDVIYLLYVFTKGDADNLSAEGKKAMRELAEQIKTQYR